MAGPDRPRGSRRGGERWGGRDLPPGGGKHGGTERGFAEYVGAPHAVATSSGTAALHLACLALGLGSGDEVVVPSMTFVATVNAVAYTGAVPVFADIVSLTEPWLDPVSVESAITDRT